MEWIYVIGSVFCAWTLLRIVGGERERRIEHCNLLLRIKAQNDAANDQNHPPTVG